jgi:hypothetical protein
MVVAYATMVANPRTCLVIYGLIDHTENVLGVDRRRVVGWWRRETVRTFFLTINRYYCRSQKEGIW